MDIYKGVYTLYLNKRAALFIKTFKEIFVILFKHCVGFKLKIPSQKSLTMNTYGIPAKLM